MLNNLQTLQQEISSCQKCLRLIQFCKETKNKKGFEDFAYWNKPVQSFGDPNAKLVIIGLAPGRHGANRTGRPFTGDEAGILLYKALYKYNFSNTETAFHVKDGLILNNAYLLNAVRCCPPDNKPSALEFKNCQGFLKQELELLTNKKILLAIGGDALKSIGIKKKFKHNNEYTLGEIKVISSYHTSGYNIKTKRLTEAMFFDVFEKIKQYL